MSANSGVKWVDRTFDFFVELLVDSARFLGISYEEINVWLFVVIWPLFSFILLAEVIRLRIKKDFILKSKK